MFYAYLLASRRNGTLYAGSTDDLRARVEQHKRKHFSGFTAKYGVDRLVWFETHPARDQAFIRERRIKQWRRLWKIQLIEARNPNWLDLYDDLDRLLLEDEIRGLAEYAITTPPFPLIPPQIPLIRRKPGPRQELGERCGTKFRGAMRRPRPRNSFLPGSRLAPG